MSFFGSLKRILAAVVLSAGLIATVFMISIPTDLILRDLTATSVTVNVYFNVAEVVAALLVGGGIFAAGIGYAYSKVVSTKSLKEESGEEVESGEKMIATKEY